MAAEIPRKLWEHPNPRATAMWAFKESLEKEKGISLPTYYDLYTWSVKNRSYTTVVDESARIDSIPSWFEGVWLNFAENMLFTAEKIADGTHLITRAGKEDNKVVATQVREGAAEPAVSITWSQLRQRTGKLLQALKAAGLTKGDRVAVVAGNSIDTLVVFLAVTALGGLFSSASTDTGVKGILDRLVQIKPKFVFFDDAAVYNGKHIDLRPKITEVVDGLKDTPEFESLITLPRFPGHPVDVASLPKTQLLAQLLATASSDKLEFVRVGFRDPFLVAFSSGTTGKPKPIVHGVGGYLLNSNKESRLHRSHGPNSITLQFTTTGWIMYIPFIPDCKVLIRLLGRYKVTHFGISPRTEEDLSSLTGGTSTGMFLPDSLAEWFYDTNPITPLYLGGCQGLPLGIPVEVYDQADEGVSGVKGTAVSDGVPGELVATAAFPTMPVKFLGKDGEKKYIDSYFARFDNVWTHGDFISIHPNTKQIFFLGRSDGVLNPSGIRFGSAEMLLSTSTNCTNKITDSSKS
ncbi:hypothetical protein BDW66DRAFT_165416 [Aspergillus desertorum]